MVAYRAARLIDRLPFGGGGKCQAYLGEAVPRRFVESVTLGRETIRRTGVAQHIYDGDAQTCLRA